MKKCKMCAGTGEILVSLNWNNTWDFDSMKIGVSVTGRTSKVKCDLCKGTGVVDWITHVVGYSEILRDCESMLKKEEIESYSIIPFSERDWTLNVNHKEDADEKINRRRSTKSS